MIGLLILVMMVLTPLPLPAAPVPVRFVEGATHGFLMLRTVDGALIASGDLLQVVRGGGVESRMVFRFKDGSLFDEKVVFTQQQAWILTDEVPSFARFEGPLYTTGPVWRIELTSPRWPD